MPEYSERNGIFRRVKELLFLIAIYFYAPWGIYYHEKAKRDRALQEHGGKRG